jgi:hypothetical protein
VSSANLDTILSNLAHLSDEQRSEFFQRHDNYFADPTAGPSAGHYP